MPRFHVEYSSNNSGGGWWLKDEDWKNLEKNGWTVLWNKDDKSNSRFFPVGTERFLGTLAKYACKSFDAGDAYWAEQQAQEDFALITHQDPDAKGCSCCGQPHYFLAREIKDDHEHADCLYDYWYQTDYYLNNPT